MTVNDFRITTSAQLDDPLLPISAHLIALRNILIRISIYTCLMILTLFLWRHHLLSFLIKPYASVVDDSNHRLIYTSLTEAFTSYFNTLTLLGLCLTSPFIILEIWYFCKPALFKSERRFFIILLIIVPVFFFIGMIFSYLWVLPSALKFFISFESYFLEIPLQLEPKISEYLTTVINIMFAFGIAFQLPVVLIFLSKLGLLTSRYLLNNWRISVIAISIVCAIITPPDLCSMILMMIPMLLLYILTIIVIFIVEKRRSHA